MKVSLDWLNEYVRVDLQAEEIAEALSDLGLPCEGIERLDGDTVLDVEVTSNRGDCLSHIGIARELAAATGKELRVPQVELQEMERLPDVILLDIEMPRMDGFEVASRVRHTGRLQDIPIIMITSRTGEKHRERALGLGVNRYLGKPYQEMALLQAISEVLGEVAAGEPTV